MRHEDEHIDDKRDKTEEKVDDVEDEEDEKISCGVGGGMRMGGNSHDEHDECKKCGDRVDYKNGGKSTSDPRRQVECLRVLGEQISWR